MQCKRTPCTWSYHHLGCSYPGGKGVGGGEGLLPIFILGGSVLSKASICSVHVFQTFQTTFYTHFQIKLQKSTPYLHVRPDEIYIPIENQFEKTINI